MGRPRPIGNAFLERRRCPEGTFFLKQLANLFALPKTSPSDGYGVTSQSAANTAAAASETGTKISLSSVKSV
jgi:hypothetical protein